MLAVPAQRLRELLEKNQLIVMPCCFDAFSAKLVEHAGFDLTFMSGFAVAGSRYGLPDLGLVSYGEMVDHGRAITAAVKIPVIGDGDTGYGGVLNVIRTVEGYARAGFAAVMIEDQVWPKRCGHTAGKSVLERDEAIARIRAAVSARDTGAGILILARTDARATHGLDEAIVRARAFSDAGADILFVEAPHSEREMAAICLGAPGRHLANMLEGGTTPVLPPERLQALGFAIAAYPLTLFSAAARAMVDALADLRVGRDPSVRLLPFADVRALLGFEALDEQARKFSTEPVPRRTIF